MALLDDLMNPALFEIRRGPGCTVCLLLAELDESESEALAGLLANQKVASAALSRVLTAHGHKVAEGTLSRHRLGKCRGVDR